MDDRARAPSGPTCWSIFRRPSHLEWRLARRYLRSRRTTSVASLNTVISTGGVAVGVMALIVVLGVMNGLRNDLRERILVANPHLRVLTFGAGLRMDDWRKALTDHPAAAGRRRGGARGHQPGGHHGGPGLRRGRQPGRVRPRHRHALGHLAAAVDPEGRPLVPDHQAERGRRHPARRPARQPALGLPGRRRHPGARHPGQGEPRARRGGAAVLAVRGHRPVRHRHVSVRQPVRRREAGCGAAVHRAGRRGVRDRGPGGRSRPGARRSARRSSSGWATPTAPSTGRPRTRACSARSSSRSWPWD